ncbi:MAG: hypothetical protein ACI38U_02275 [Corynebacterium sp.]|uniref:hypothetical protein n=1 Tax=Corynebacterium sp. TaxID=1720 RepID=UPI003F030CDC
MSTDYKDDDVQVAELDVMTDDELDRLVFDCNCTLAQVDAFTARRQGALALDALMVRLTVVLCARAALTDGRDRASREIAARSSIGGGDGR